jgi:serine/threonine protein kinase, bacterial
MPAGGGAQTVLPFNGLDLPYGVAVDGVGTVYVADLSNNRVLKLSAGTSTQTALPFIGLNHPSGVAVDAAGNLYITDRDNKRVLKLPVQ